MELVIISQPRVFPYRRLYRIAKRIMDVTLCLVALPFLIPLMAFCALAIWLDSPGPIFFIQERVGKDGRLFQMYKFRTMQHKLDDSSHRTFMKAFVNGKIGSNGSNNGSNNGSGKDMGFHRAFKRAFVNQQVGNLERDGQIYKPFRTSQVTWVGRILRKTSLDELTQIINVLRGEMSLVGPRPNVPWEVEEYEPWHYERLEVLPGITGLAQVRGRSGIGFDSIVGYDIEYVENWSLALDLKILLWTGLSVVDGAGAG
jgi:lipopolysaccharide/colanic/teichoic acid biosynthesis glycosyltransferase